MLIGNNVPLAMEPLRVINSDYGGPFACETVLGWVVHGFPAEFPRPTTSVNRIALIAEGNLPKMKQKKTEQTREIQSLNLRKESEIGIGSLQEMIDEKEDRRREVSDAKNKLQLELEQLQGEAARKVEHLTRIVQRQENEISSMREELSKKSDLVRTMNLNQDSNVENFKDMLSETMREFSRREDNKDREISDTRSQLSSKDEDYERKMKMKEDHIRELQRESNEVRQDMPKMKQSLNNVEPELSSVKAELQRVNGMMSVKEVQIQEQQDGQLQLKKKPPFPPNISARTDYAMPDEKGVVRRVKLKMQTSTLVRPVSRTCLLLEGDE